jgi:hypothetical protein
MQGKVAYIRLKVVRPFLGHCANRSYVHQSALLQISLTCIPIKQIGFCTISNK